ncbi:MAG: protein kinase [Alloacidobacterium sp.]
MAQRQELIELLFEAALERLPKELQRFLARGCGDDQVLRGSVEQLLRDFENAGSFLEKPLLNPAKNQGSTLNIHASNSEFSSTPAHVPSFQPGDVIAKRFCVRRVIARGGMGEVYEVEDQDLHGAHVALKTILPEIAGDPAMQARFEREVLAARQVIHPHLCPIYQIDHCDIEDQGRLHFLTMKLLTGETLAARLKRLHTLSLQEVSAIVHQVGSGLAAAHKAGIIHRDIKPSNIMLDGLDANVYACLTDFGLARSLYFGDTTEITLSGVAGTLGYLAPELFQGQPPSQASDIYSFGVITYEMLIGHLPVFPVKAQERKGAKPQFRNLPAAWQRLITGCLEADVSRRYTSVQRVLDELDDGHRRISRRTAIRLGLGATVAMGGAVWVEWPRIDFLFNPLPDKRSVALIAWPAPRSEDSGLLSTILESIKNRLARAEAYVRNLLIISSVDNPDATSKPLSPKDALNSLGANLVLTAAIHEQRSNFVLTLQLLNTVTQKVLRKGHVSSPSSQLSMLADQGYSLAARVLDLQERKDQLEDSDEMRDLPPEAYRDFTEAEHLANEPNDAGLDAAIEKYESVLTIVPKFSAAYAQIAIAYVRKFLLDGGQVCLDLASRNADLALHNPRSIKALLSKALVYSYTGKTDEALDYFDRALRLDPENPDVLLYRAHTFRDLNRWADEEKAYRDLLKVRPNYWPAYDELGWVLSRQARYKEAAAAFEAASIAAPGVALPLANLSTMYLELGKLEDASEASRRSIAKYPNWPAYLNLGDIAFARGNYREALDNYQKAKDLDPGYHMIWRNIADCYAMFGQEPLVHVNYAKAAELLSNQLRISPKGGYAWMTLSFYHAKAGAVADAQEDLRNAEAQGASDVESQFMKAQTLMLLGKKDDALAIVIDCLDKGLSPVEVDLALDLKDIRKDPRYKSHLATLTSPSQRAS